MKGSVKLTLQVATLIVLTLHYNSLFGQNSPASMPKIIPPSPNASAFSKYGSIPVSAYTGVANIDIPLYEISVRDIKVPISLSYHPSGIKVGEESSRVGLGWVLNAGGLISRNIVNLDDLQDLPYAFLSNFDNHPAIPQGPVNSPAGWVQGQNGSAYQYYSTQQQSGTPIAINLTQYLTPTGIDPLFVPTDFEPDQFNYNFLNHSGQFSLNRNKEVILGKQEKIRIRPTITTNGTTWEVTTPDGFIYNFIDSESIIDTDNTPGYQQQTAWYLSEIISPQGEHVAFHYTTLSSSRILPVGSFYERKSSITLSCSDFNCQNPPTLRYLSTGKSYSNIFLDRIEWSTGKIVFNVANDRLDLEGDIRITSMQIFKKDALQPYQEVAFSQDYFTSPPPGVNSQTEFPTPTGDAANKVLKRLKLTGATKRPLPAFNNDNSQVYSFSYNEPSFIPAKNSFARDHWGYFNGKGNTSLLPTYKTVVSGSTINLFNQLIGVRGPERDPSAADMPMLSLRSITYPTKGTTTFYYSANEYEIPPITPGAEADNPETYTIPTTLAYNIANKGFEQSTQFDLRDEYVDPNGHVVPIKISAAFRTDFTTPCNAIGSTNDVYFQLVDANGLSYLTVTPNGNRCSNPEDIDCISCVTGSPVFTYNGFVTVQPGIYYWKAKIPNNENRIVDISSIFTWTVDASKRPQAYPNSDGSIPKYRVGGGLRISKIEDFDPSSNKKTNVRKYEYRYKTDVDNDGIMEAHSYGRLMVKPNYSYYDVSWEKVSNGGSSTSGCTACYSLQRDSGHPSANYSGIPVAYDKVIEYMGENGENGYTEYEYENIVDELKTYTYPYNNDNLPIRPPLTNSVKNPGNGNLIRQSHFNASGIKLMMSENTYQKMYNDILFGLNTREIPGRQDFSTAAGGNVIIDTGYGFLLLAYQTVNSYFSFLSTTTTTTYVAAQQLRVQTQYFYDNPQHLQLTRMIKDENNLQTITKVKYPADYLDTESNSAILNMKNEKFMHALPIETTELTLKPNSNPLIKTSSVTIYDNFGSYILPKDKLILENTSLLDPALVPAYNPANPSGNQLYKLKYSIDYNGYGNPKKIQKSQDVAIGYIWNENQTFPIAEITNGLPDDSFYTSFEGNGQIVLDGSGINLAKTGEMISQSSAFTFPVSYAPTNESNALMSYWYWSNNIWNFSGIVPFQRSFVTTGTMIDEIRAFPISSQMTTYTYDESLGLTSSTDINNQTTYFEYDGLGRLKMIRDAARNILKTYTYKYKN